MTMTRYGRAAAAAAVGLLAATTGGLGGADAAAGPAGDAEAGAELYAAQCRGCHTVSIAPTLRGVADRPIAGVSGFGGYSEALRAKASQRWTAETLDAFLAAPQAFAPGTRMVMAVPDAQARADVISYLLTLPPPRAAQ